MNLQYKVKYEVGGYPNPTYEGNHQVGINVPDDYFEADAKNQARSKARKEISRDFACDAVYVKINAIWRV